MTMATLTNLMGWITLVNIGLLLLTTVLIVLMKGIAIKIHSKMFDIDTKDLNNMYFDYLGKFKVLVIVFNLGPYIALRLMT